MAWEVGNGRCDIEDECPSLFDSLSRDLALFIKNKWLYVSIAISIVSISVFGFFKDYLMIGTKISGAKGAIQTMIVGAIAGRP